MRLLSLHLQLARVEWAQERQRLEQAFSARLIRFACLLSSVLFVSALALALAWDTPYRIPVAVALAIAHGSVTVMAWRRVSVLSEQGEQRFALTRAQIDKDRALLNLQR
jgi:uncharacterized membrane protein YqjE